MGARCVNVCVASEVGVDYITNIDIFSSSLCVCVRACVRACVGACVGCVCVDGGGGGSAGVRGRAKRCIIQLFDIILFFF